jgi:hypothetical protein
MNYGPGAGGRRIPDVRTPDPALRPPATAGCTRPGAEHIRGSRCPLANSGTASDTQGMQLAALIAIAFGGIIGWIWKRCHHAWSDWRSTITRMKGARRAFRRELPKTALALVVVVLVVRLLLL